MYDKKIAYNLLEQVQSDLESSIYEENDNVQVLMDIDPLFDGFYPIVFYYPSHIMMEAMYSRNDFDIVDEKDHVTNNEFYSIYLKDKPNLIDMKFSDMVFYIEETISILESE